MPRNQAARGAEAGEGGGLAAQWEGHERVAYGSQGDAFTRPCGRDRAGPHRIGEFAPAEELFHRHSERAGQGKGDAQRGVGMTRLEGGHRLSGNSSHAGSCCWDSPRACRAIRSAVPAAQETSVMGLA